MSPTIYFPPYAPSVIAHCLSTKGHAQKTKMLAFFPKKHTFPHPPLAFFPQIAPRTQNTLAIFPNYQLLPTNDLLPTTATYHGPLPVNCHQSLAGGQMPSPVHPYSDYGVALRTLRSSRGWLGFLLLACVVWQFVGFSLMFWTQQPYRNMRPERASIEITHAPATSAAVTVEEDNFFPGTPQSHRLNVRNQWDTTYTMLVPVTQLAAVIAVSSQAIVVFITLLVVLVAQAPGVAQITRSLIWSILLLFMFLPWQYFAKDFPIPGVIYSYAELLRLIEPHVTGQHVARFQTFLLYARFIAWPLIGLFVLLITAERFRAGIMIAIGHPLQSILQPRAGVGNAKGPTMATMGIPSLEKK